MKQLTTLNFSEQVLAWFDQHGRKDLPWQQAISPYRVWLSEIMLQQTQVATVIPYFERFIERYPDVTSLACAHQDEVLHLWTGLGYYSRARNLHKTAQRIVDDYNGEFPSDVDNLSSLPGIGRSTAGAITAIAFQKSAAILDGNVKRVLARHFAIDGWPGNGNVMKQLWTIAEQLKPEHRIADYTQAMMDLGATLCTRSKPQCQRCPLQQSCQAYKDGAQTNFPGKKPKKILPVKTTQLLMIENLNGEWLLEKRPSQGIWGGLWSFPQLDIDEAAEPFLATFIEAEHYSSQAWPSYRHTFSHYHLDITPVHITLIKAHTPQCAQQQQLWYNSTHDNRIGLAAPVKKLLEALTKQAS